MTRPKATIRRCAVYTRKSSEEGLEQEFNSLHAQREACEAYIRSQQGEGWALIGTAYDDGGLSGGTMERPALQRLLEDITQGRVDIVVVYKVDRLTRSLIDFAKIVELFDRHGVSFVAVTQHFNTTTSMGRLTLNILLSFAQFEREVTGERIRDKIAASKKKGMWMGGTTPLGYEVENHKLIVIPEEARTVRYIYRRYLELGSVRRLKEHLDREGIRSKLRTYEDGTRSGGVPLARGALYALLSNPIYVGEIRHKDLRYPGLHEPIIDRDLWDAVQQRLRDQGSSGHTRTTKVAASPLMGKLFDEAGRGLTPSHALKGGRRYRYYISRGLVTGTAEKPGWRLPASQIEQVVAAEAAAILADRAAIGTVLEKAGVSPSELPAAFSVAASIQRRLRSDAERDEALAVLIGRVDLSAGVLRLTIALEPLAGIAGELTRDIPLKIKRRGVEMRLIVQSGRPAPPKADPTLLKEITRAHRCFEALRTGDASIAGLARREGVDDRYISSVLPLAFLAPDIVEAILQGRQPADLNATKLVRRIDLALDWREQKRQLGFE
jgi:site-specific DNA recombinase